MCLCRLLARDAGGETEGVLLNETVPAWVVDIVVEKKLPKFIKVGWWLSRPREKFPQGTHFMEVC